MRYGLLILTLISGTLTCAQPHRMAKELASMAMDSVLLSVYQVATREMVKSEDEIMERQLAQCGIPKDELKEILRKASKKSSFQNDRALLTHYNIIIEYYQNGEPVAHFTLSSKTGNITISDLSSNAEVFGRVSSSYGNYLIDLLQNYDMLRFIDQLDLEGFE